MLELYLNSWKNYNEGKEGSCFVALPMEVEELENICKELGEEIFIQDWETDMHGLSILESDNIYALNGAMLQVEELDDYELDKLYALLECHTSDIDEALELLENAELWCGCETLTDLAHEFVEDGLLGEMSEIAQRYFDYGAYGHDLGFVGYTETSKGVLYVG